MSVQLTPKFRQVIALAKQAAQRYNHEFISSSHVLLGLLELGDCRGLKVLKELKIDLIKFKKDIHIHLNQIVGITKNISKFKSSV